MGGGTAAGTTLSVSAGKPATSDAAGYAALTWTEVGGVEKLGVIGATVNKTEFLLLKGTKLKMKGSADHGTLQPNMLSDAADAGQTIIRTFADPDNKAEMSVKLTYPDGAIRYSGGPVFGSPENVDGADAALTETPTIELTRKIIKVAAPS
ncbi:hypothetical protein GG804_26100 [Sphingomonas histidinilytica]|uniref:hypothetical protein n=1 Tax=Rhizorhabdus histidinilytica TaxID=439228 RepID=UPI000F79593D|nr:hypothetical protein [Rhizorhabdus histidinilytica]MBO9380242.1 hypothetical protein [Rhizorhabdus histidinilytica]QEH81190.1 hypothetical protein EIK56_25140 [Sphingomonas sp. C8-2]